MWMEPAPLAEVPSLLPWSFSLSFYRAGEDSRPLLLLFTHKVMSNSFVTPWTAAHRAPLSVGFSRQEY